MSLRGSAAARNLTDRNSLPRSIAVACDEPLQWSLFELLRGSTDTKVVACSTLRQLADVCEHEVIDAVIVDVDHFGLDSVEAAGLADLLGRRVKLIAVTAGPPPWTGALARDGRLRWIRRPVSAEQILMLLRQGSQTAYVRGVPPRSHS